MFASFDLFLFSFVDHPAASSLFLSSAIYSPSIIFSAAISLSSPPFSASVSMEFMVTGPYMCFPG